MGMTLKTTAATCGPIVGKEAPASRRKGADLSFQAVIPMPAVEVVRVPILEVVRLNGNEEGIPMPAFILSKSPLSNIPNYRMAPNA